jgi:Protein of unknown function (DUF3311)
VVRSSPTRDAGRRAGRSAWHWLLLLPIVVPLASPLYNRMEPRLLGFPFFYWFQLAGVGFAMVVTAAVYLLTKGER